MSVIKTGKRFLIRNKGQIPSKLRSELMGRLLRVNYLRKFVSFFAQPKEPKKWIFITGCYNSGTTLLREIIGSHKDVSSMPFEGVRFTDVFKRPDDLGWERNWVFCHDQIALHPESNARLKTRLLKDWSWWIDTKKVFFLEKSISNIPRINWINKNLSAVYFISITRHPYPVIEGIMRRAKVKMPAARQYGQAEYKIQDVAKQWLVSNQEMKKSLEAASNHLPLRYEDFVTDPKNIINSICDFLGIDPKDFEMKENEVMIGGRSFSISDHNASSVARLSKEDISKINNVIKVYSKSLNYETL
jgi:hypothetical protein